MSIQISSAELVSRIISDPSFANEIINYMTNIKPKLNSLSSKLYIIEKIESTHAEQMDEYKKLLKKLHNKYVKLESSVKTHSDVYKSCEVKTQTIQKLTSDLSECKVCESKDKLIVQLKDELELAKQLVKQTQATSVSAAQIQPLPLTCKSCEDKTDIIKNMTQMLTAPCAKCEAKDDKLAKITKKKDSAIRDLLQKVKQLENENLAKDSEFEKLNKLLRLELNKSKKQAPSPAQELSQVQNQVTKPIINQVPTQNSSQDTVLGELYKQFGNFISITEQK